MSHHPEQQPEKLSSVRLDESVQGQDQRKGAFISNSTFYGDVIGQQTVLAPGLSPRDRNSRRRLLKHVRLSWIEGVLDQSLYREVLIALNLQTDPQAVGFSGPRLAIQRNQNASSLPSGTTIAQVYQQANQRLLILGAPGGGKTTLLLELARTLLEQALHDETRPMPVIFNLSSWVRQHLPLEDWLVQELRDQYRVARRIARQWLRDNRILPLLDGLDEVAETQRAACVASINHFIEEHGGEGLVVCSRSADYQAIGSKLLLDQAVQIQLLDNEQIETYLDNGGSALAGVRAVLAQDAELHELARAPLLLNILSLAYQDQRPEELQGLQAVAQQRRLFDSYVQRMFERPARNDPKRYARDQTLHWLRWLATRLVQNNQTVFQIELMQPWWLQCWWQRGLYVLFATLGTTATGAILGALFGLLFSLLLNAAFAGLLWGFPAVVKSNATLLAQDDWLIAITLIGLVGGALNGLSAGLASGLVISLLQRIPKQPHLALAVMGGAVAAGIACLLWLLAINSRGLVLFFWGFWGVAFALINAVLIRRGAIQPTVALRWDWRILRRRWYFGLVLGLGGAVVAGIATAPLFGLRLSSIIGLFSAMIFAMFFMPAFGLLGVCLSGLTQIDIQTNTRPNQGTWRSLMFATGLCLFLGASIGLFISISVGFILGILFSTFSGFVDGIIIGLINGLSFGIVLALGIAPVAALYYGGITFAQHFALRVVCAVCGNAPWNYPRFLNYAAECLLIRRLGGSYIFIHRMLQEHFAQHDSINNSTHEHTEQKHRKRGM